MSNLCYEGYYIAGLVDQRPNSAFSEMDASDY